MRWREWLGVGERRWKKAPDEEVQPAKTLWDWLQLLIVPAILIGVTFAWSAEQTSRDNRRTEETRQDTTLQTYLDQMSGLMLNKELLASRPDSPVRAVARTVTLGTLRRLDGDRKGEVVRFLVEAHLLDLKHPRLRLDGADLSGVVLIGAHLEDVTLEGLTLNHADLRFAKLDRSNLEGANLENANLEGAGLYKANLFLAHLARANLDHAYLAGAKLSMADFSDAILVGASFESSDLQDARLDGADLTNAYFRNAFIEHTSFVGADLTYADLRETGFVAADLEGADLTSAVIERTTDFGGADNLDLDRLISELPPKEQKLFLRAQKQFLDSLSPEELAKFNLSPEKLAKFRREAGGD
jgi:uncharacterized protein YjbI with pentapeptide repeats